MHNLKQYQVEKKSKAALGLLAAAILSVNAATANAGFVDDSQLDLKLRNVHFDFKTDDSSKNWDQWSQGVELNFRSGYFADTVGFDVSYYGALKLDHGGVDKHGKMGGQLLGKNGESYHKLGQAYIKTKLGDDKLGFYGQAGYMSGSKGLILGSASRSTPSSYRGLHGEVNVDDFTVYGTYVDQISYRTESRWDNFKTAAGDKVDNIWQLGGTYNANNLNAEAVYLQSKNYHRQYMTNLGYTFVLADDTSLSVDGNFHRAEGHGSLWGKTYKDSKGKEQTTGKFDDKAYHVNLNTQLQHGGLGVMLSYSHSKAEKTGGLGYFDYVSADNEYGASPSQTGRYVSDFMYDNESVWQLQGTYNFADLKVPGLTTTVAHTRGYDIKDQSANKMSSEYETDLIVSYAFQGKLDGLTFKGIKAWHTARYDAKDNVDTEHLRVYLDYTVSIF